MQSFLDIGRVSCDRRVCSMVAERAGVRLRHHVHSVRPLVKLERATRNTDNGYVGKANSWHFGFNDARVNYPTFVYSLLSAASLHCQASSAGKRPHLVYPA